MKGLERVPKNTIIFTNRTFGMAGKQTWINICVSRWAKTRTLDKHIPTCPKGREKKNVLSEHIKGNLKCRVDSRELSEDRNCDLGLYVSSYLKACMIPFPLCLLQNLVFLHYQFGNLESFQ